MFSWVLLTQVRSVQARLHTDCQRFTHTWWWANPHVIPQLATPLYTSCQSHPHNNPTLHIFIFFSAVIFSANDLDFDMNCLWFTLCTQFYDLSLYFLNLIYAFPHLPPHACRSDEAWPASLISIGCALECLAVPVCDQSLWLYLTLQGGVVASSCLSAWVVGVCGAPWPPISSSLFSQ